MIFVNVYLLFVNKITLELSGLLNFFFFLPFINIANTSRFESGSTSNPSVKKWEQAKERQGSRHMGEEGWGTERTSPEETPMSHKTAHSLTFKEGSKRQSRPRPPGPDSTGAAAASSFSSSPHYFWALKTGFQRAVIPPDQTQATCPLLFPGFSLWVRSTLAVYTVIL